ncbi:AGE family epimerase/isomerase [Fictibacillus enclensis]|uniref:AGE family epimerase/isomerase n=1 Tax=Fictibacillus enclensis TaxID=1017270 RepID=UPI0025A30E41|nr:AGE family epimerase/isomerase [Fictibacillus enclensis]MDM5201114.1 AGE family epimerase/isomerase [Fictibacillus enclensis]
MNFNELLKNTERHVQTSLLPFWEKAMDHVYGGVYTCFNNKGDTLLSRDKYTWSQGRFLWIESRLYQMMKKGLMNGDQEFFLQHAEKTYEFLMGNSFLENGNCTFLLTEDGKKKESVAGEGYDTSFFADCFVILGLSEYSRATRNQEILTEAINTFNHLLNRLDMGKVRSEPYPVPQGFSSHSFPMILLNVAQELAESAEQLGSPDASSLEQQAAGFMTDVMNTFRMKDGTIQELKTDQETLQDTLLYRHRNPGHGIECMWFVMALAEKRNEAKVMEEACMSILAILDKGWDHEYGGLYRFIDVDGGKPQGRRTSTEYERLIEETWDTKLWWPHSEALYATLYAFCYTRNPAFEEWFHRIQEYVLQTFPNENQDVGEWIQIRDRKGMPINKLVALPVKDPYHILRNFLLMIELLQKQHGGE